MLSGNETPIRSTLFPNTDDYDRACGYSLAFRYLFPFILLFIYYHYYYYNYNYIIIILICISASVGVIAFAENFKSYHDDFAAPDCCVRFYDFDTFEKFGSFHEICMYLYLYFPFFLFFINLIYPFL